MAVAELPLLDEHTAEIDAAPADVWVALLRILDRRFAGAGTYARLVGCADPTASGPRPLTEGSTLVGFRVITAEKPSLLGLAGHHRFSDYALTFRIDDLDGPRSRLRAESQAAFPGGAGRFYRFLLVSTGGHVFVVRRLLSSVRHAAERLASN